VDAQSLINILVGACGFFGGWMINSLSKSIIRIEDRIAELPMLYVSKDDYREDIADIKAMLSKIFDKLDGKVDK
jgi:hypothetical protein